MQGQFFFIPEGGGSMYHNISLGNHAKLILTTQFSFTKLVAPLKYCPLPAGWWVGRGGGLTGSAPPYGMISTPAEILALKSPKPNQEFEKFPFSWGAEGGKGGRGEGGKGCFWKNLDMPSWNSGSTLRPASNGIRNLQNVWIDIVYRLFHNYLPKSGAHVPLISVRNYEMCILRSTHGVAQQRTLQGPFKKLTLFWLTSYKLSLFIS